jgi:hypothetical protein
MPAAIAVSFGNDLSDVGSANVHVREENIRFGAMDIAAQDLYPRPVRRSTSLVVTPAPE